MRVARSPAAIRQVKWNAPKVDSFGTLATVSKERLSSTKKGLMAETQKATVVFGVLNETSQDETRVALTPDIVTRLKKAGVSCLVQSGAGIAAQYTDDDYAKAGPRSSPRTM